VPLIAVGIAGVIIATIAAWYFFLRAPAPTPSPDAAFSPTPAPPPVTAAEAASPVPSAPPTVEPTKAPTPGTTPVTAPATPTPSPRVTPTPTPTPAVRQTPPRTTPAPPAGNARALLAQGAYPDAARAFATSLATGPRGRFSFQVLVACAPENVQKAVSAVPADDLFILPVNVKGKDCYRLCWGVYDGRPAAEAALGGLPSYFRQGGATPRLSPLAELLP